MKWKRYTFIPVLRNVKCIIVVSIQVIFFVFLVLWLLHNDLQEKLNPHRNIILMGQFNYFSNNITTWIDTWSKIINRTNIVIAAPCPKPERCISDNIRSYPVITPSKYNFYVYDGGYVSPYYNMIKIIRETDDLYGIMYVHDDVLLSKYILEKIGGKEWIVSNFDKRTITVYENLTIASSRNLTKLYKWNHWIECQDKFIKMFHDGRLQPYMHRSTDINLYINITTGPSDMLYAVFPDFEQKHSFLDILELFSDYYLCLECAIPTAVSLMQERYGIKVHNTTLCTDWSSRRFKPKEMIERCFRANVESYGVYHPIKISYNNDWTQYFDYLRRL